MTAPADDAPVGRARPYMSLGLRAPDHYSGYVHKFQSGDLAGVVELFEGQTMQFYDPAHLRELRALCGRLADEMDALAGAGQAHDDVVETASR